MSKIGYTLGCFDLLHIGHINLLRNAKKMCDKLIVGVLDDEYLNKKKNGGFYNLQDRINMLKAIKYCDVVVVESITDKMKLWKKYKFDVLFSGDDWINTPEYKKWEEELKNVGCKVIYFPYTKNISTTEMKEKLKEA